MPASGNGIDVLIILLLKWILDPNISPNGPRDLIVLSLMRVMSQTLELHRTPL